MEKCSLTSFYLLCAIFIVSDPATCCPLMDETWELLWSDEFDGPAGSPPSASNWVYNIGNRNGPNGTNLGWGNRELEYYTNSTENVRLDGQGNLVIEAHENTDANLSCYYGTCKYTSARIHTGGKFNFKYGHIEANIKIPKGQGIWPALWMLGIRYFQDGWPICGEIDIMENIGKEPMQTHGALHAPGYDPVMNFTTNEVIGDDFHRFTVVWNESEIVWYVDDVEFGRQLAAEANSTQWVFDADFFILLNLAIGGNWPSNPNASTEFPQQMVIDYVRVYQQKSGNSSTLPSTVPPTDPMPEMVTVSVNTKSSWSSGASFEFAFKNSGSKPVCGVNFTMVLASGETVSSSWNMEKTSNNSNEYTLPSWLKIAPDATYKDTGLVVSGGTAPPTVSVVSHRHC